RRWRRQAGWTWRYQDCSVRVDADTITEEKVTKRACESSLSVMPKPVMLTVDDDPEVLRAIERDLRGHYADRYRVMRANSGSAALSTLKELKARNNPVALLLADQRMPQMDGVGFLTQAMDIHPQAK